MVFVLLGVLQAILILDIWTEILALQQSEMGCGGMLVELAVCSSTYCTRL